MKFQTLVFCILFIKTSTLALSLRGCGEDISKRVQCGTSNLTKSQCEQIFNKTTNLNCCFDNRLSVSFNCFQAAETIKPRVRRFLGFNFWNRPGKTVAFTATPDILGNTVPTGAILSQKPTYTEPNLSLFNLQPAITKKPAIATTTTDSTATEEIKSTEATDKPRNNFANFLDDLGVELDSVEFLTVKPGTGALGTNVAASKSPPLGETPSNIDTSGVDIQIAICSYFEQNPDVSPQVKEVFKETLKKCVNSGPTVSPAVAEEVLRKEIQKIIESQVTESLPTKSPNQLNNLLNPSNLLSVFGGKNPTTNPLSALGNLNAFGSNGLSSGSNMLNIISALQGNGNSNSGGLLSTLLQGSNPGIASLLGNGGNTGLSSLLGGGNSGLASLLGNGGESSKTQLLLTMMQQQQIAAQQAANKEPVNVGIQEPIFVPTPAPRKPNYLLCQFLMTKMQDSDSKISSLMRIQYMQGGCLNQLLSNPLALLRDGALDQIKEILGLSEKVDEFENAATGPIDLSLVPSGVLTDCLKRRDEFNSNYNCKTGVNINIRTEQECINIGCIYAPGNLCFRCPLIKRNYESNQMPQLTCSVAQDNRQECSGFGKYNLITMLSSSQSYNPYGSSFGGTSGLEGGLVQGPGSSTSGSSTALLNQLLQSQRSSTKNQSEIEQFNNMEKMVEIFVMVRDSIKEENTTSNDTKITNKLQTILNHHSQSSSETIEETDKVPKIRQGLSSTLLTSLMGGSLGSNGGGSSVNPLLMSLLGGGSTSSLFGGGSTNSFGGGFSVTSQLLKSKCESLGCCYDENSFSNPCYKKDYTTNQWIDQASCFESDCGTSSSDFLGKLFGVGLEQATTSDDRPWQVIIKQPGSTQTICTGVIICKQWVLTTASCLIKKEDPRHPLGFVVSIDPTSLEVYHGTIDPVNSASSGTKTSVLQIVRHPSYVVSQSVHDIALLKIDPLTFSSSVKPVCLPKFASSSLQAGESVYVSGYGSTTLQEIKMNTVSYEDCKNIYTTSLPNGGVFCANPDTTGDTCKGDGGSPALKYENGVYTVVGINFGGSPSCDGSSPSIFTDISRYRNWIAQTTNNCCTIASLRWFGK